MPKGDVKGAWVNSPQADAVAEYYVAGHSVRDTANRFGVSMAQVNHLAKKRHLTNGRNNLEAGRATVVANQKRRAEERIASRLSEFGFDYLGGYLSPDDTVRYRCRQCGTEVEHRADFVRDGNIVCRKCEHEKAVDRQTERKRIAKQQAEARAIERRWAKLMQPKNALLSKSGICEICGNPYTVEEYVKSAGLKYARDNGVCSSECRKEKRRRQAADAHKGRRDSHRHRAKKWNCEYDPSVTLPRLIGRDGLRCAICGEMCDPNDRGWSKYFGPMSPTIDHIVPMAKGGGHVWNNVQIAHAICNSYKSDHIEEVI